MKIAIFTNSYPPYIGGVATSVSGTAGKLKEMGHEVMVVAPSFEGPSDQKDKDYVFRLFSIKNISGSDFSLPFPFSAGLNEKLTEFCPDIIHSNYPLLVGDMALRYGALMDIPVVFTHHTRYEAYEELLPWELDGLDQLLMDLSVGYANLCSHVIVPTHDMALILKNKGVKSPVSIIPTGMDTKDFSNGKGKAFRQRYAIPRTSFVVGYTGRLAPEKNLKFWSEAVSSFLLRTCDTHALVIGSGEAESEILKIFRKANVADRLTMAGELQGRSLIDSYHAMDVFAFASKMETQGLVLVESLAAGCPVLALDVQCVRNVISDGKDGRLVSPDDADAFSEALIDFASMNKTRYAQMCRAAIKKASHFNIDRCIDKTLKLYSELAYESRPGIMEVTGWKGLGKLAIRESNLWRSRLGALGSVLFKRKKTAN